LTHNSGGEEKTGERENDIDVFYSKYTIKKEKKRNTFFRIKG
jgi:hypothetical protein